MEKKNKVRKLMGSGILALCMVAAILFTVFRTNASGEATAVSYEKRTYESKGVAPEKEGYLFGGWYAEENDDSVVEAPELGTQYYAKFVPEGVLGIKAQVSSSILEKDSTAEKAAIRFVTTIDDSLHYQKVGFKINRGTGDKDVTVTNKVYTSLYEVTDAAGTAGAEQKVLPTVFNEASKYFKTYSLWNVPDSAYDTDITVTPYWITLDGTRVEGTKSIKTVNLGRSWIYVDTSANTDSAGEFGTYNHPFTALDIALDTVGLENGKITVKGKEKFEVPSTFEWNKNKIKVNNKVRNITITGENGAESFISFDTVPDMGINDNVTFENVKLCFATQVYANGNDFTIAKDVVIDNPNNDTNLHGGALEEEVENTNLKIYAGSWKTIYGGGGNNAQKKKGNVKGNTSIIIENAEVYSSTSDQCMIIGGGDGSDVGGSTYITVGGTFNENANVGSHDTLSAIYGGGRSGGVVEGDTNVIIKDSAKANYVYGGGASNTTVNGTCHVTLAGGKVYGIYGGARGGDATTGGNNADTVVKIIGGEVSDIFGGNGKGMTGNTYVEVTGGKVIRRIYGGCYNDVNGNALVTGTATVVIGKNAILDFSSIESSVERICAGSRYVGEQDDEVGILIFNEDTYNSGNVLGVRADEYDYLVRATIGGQVTVTNDVAEDETMLCITPNNAETPGTMTSGSTVTYFKGAGVCELPTEEIIDINFNPANVESQLAECEARIDGIYYSTLEETVAHAVKRINKPTVTVLKNAEIDSTLNIAASEEITVESEGENKYIITGSDSSSHLFEVKGTLTVNNLTLTGGRHGIYVENGNLTANRIEIDSTYGKGLHMNGGTAEIKDITVKNVIEQELSFAVSAKATISSFKITDNVNSDNVSVYVTDNASLTLEHGEISKVPKSGVYVDSANVTLNEVSITDTGEEGIRNINGTVTFNGGTIKEAKGCGIWNTGKGVTTANNITIDSITKFGVYVETGTTVNLDNATITNINGGTTERSGIHCLGTVNITADNEAKMGVTIENVTNGHGIYVGNGTINADTINVQSVSKNGLYVNAGSTNLVKNITILNTGTQGMQFADGANVTIDGFNVIETNNTGSVTAIYTSGTSNVTLKNGTVSATKSGIYLDGDSQVTATNVNVERTGETDNTLVVVNSASAVFTLKEDGNTAAIDGKNREGVGVEVKGTFNLNDGTIANNKIVSGNGAGVRVKPGGTFNMTGGSICNNDAPIGGGVAVEGTASEAELAIFTLEGGSISDNNASDAGGGVYVKYGSFIMSKDSTGSISKNSGKNDGAGIYLLNGATFTMGNGSIEYNILSEGSARGGGVCINATDARFTFDGGTINDNVARAGGGVIIRSGEFVMNGGIICRNNANKINNNNGQGGAIYILSSNSKFTLNAGDITGNNAQSQGAAIFINGATFNWYGGMFTGYGANAIDGTSNPTVNIKSSIPEEERAVINSTNIRNVNIVN